MSASPVYVATAASTPAEEPRGCLVRPLVNKPRAKSATIDDGAVATAYWHLPPVCAAPSRRKRRMPWSCRSSLLERIKSNVGAPYLAHAGRCPSLRRRHPIRSRSQSVCGGSDPCRALAEFERGWMVISAAGPPAPGREGCRWWVWTNPRDREIRGRRSERVAACALRRVLESCAVIVVRSGAS